jgi:signal recognition particle subunit SEC65
LNIERVVLLIVFSVAFGFSTGVSQFEEVPNGLELLWAKVAMGEQSSEYRNLNMTIAVKNISASEITLLTENLQDDLVNYKDWPDKPWEIHLNFMAFQIDSNNQYLIPPVSTFSPVTLKPGEATIIKHTYKDHKNMKKAVVVFDMLSPVNDRYHTWSGRLRSGLISFKYTK